MFLIKKSVFKEFPTILGIIIYASFINWLSGRVGIIPIDSFGFLDTGFSILKNKLPIRDFWIFTGLLVDYMEAFFLLLFGNNWSSHILHASSMNVIASLSLYYFLRNINFDINKNLILIQTYLILAILLVNIQYPILFIFLMILIKFYIF